MARQHIIYNMHTNERTVEPYSAEWEAAADLKALSNPQRATLAAIRQLERLETPRRLAEAFADPTWLNANRALIAIERSKL